MVEYGDWLMLKFAVDANVVGSAVRLWFCHKEFKSNSNAVVERPVDMSRELCLYCIG